MTRLQLNSVCGWRILYRNKNVISIVLQLFIVVNALGDAKEAGVVVEYVFCSQAGFESYFFYLPVTWANYSNSLCFSLSLCKLEIMLTIS